MKILALLFLVGCGTVAETEQRHEASIEVHYPECAEIEDDELRVKCIKAASSLEVEVTVEGKPLESIDIDELLEAE